MERAFVQSKLDLISTRFVGVCLRLWIGVWSRTSSKQVFIRPETNSNSVLHFLMSRLIEIIFGHRLSDSSVMRLTIGNAVAGAVVMYADDIGASCASKIVDTLLTKHLGEFT